jgi:hypothetical protein
MRSLLLIALLMPGVSSAEEPRGWRLGTEVGGLFLKTPGASWSPGPLLGIQLKKALPSGASWGFTTRLSATRLNGTNGIWSQGELSESALDAVAVHNQWLLTLRYGPDFQSANPQIRIGVLVDGAIGVDRVRTHADLSGPEGLQRISATEGLPLIQAGLGMRILFRDSFALNTTLGGQMLFTFDRGERGGGDDLRVLFALLPGVECVGHF